VVRWKGCRGGYIIPSFALTRGSLSFKGYVLAPPLVGGLFRAGLGCRCIVLRGEGEREREHKREHEHACQASTGEYAMPGEVYRRKLRSAG